MTYLLHLIVLVSLYTTLGHSLNLLVGHAGQFVLCQAAFYATGAYTAALLQTAFDTSFSLAFALAILTSAVSGAVVAAVSYRLKGDFFVLATLAYQVIISSLIYNWTGLTRGPFGIAGIPAPVLFGFRFESVLSFAPLAVAVAALATALAHLLVRSRFGLALHAVRDDEIAAESIGKNVAQLRMAAFVTSAAIAGSAGVLYAGYARYVDPTSFTIVESTFMLAIVAVGGAGTTWGPLMGAVLLLLLPEALRWLALPASAAAELRQLMFGALLIAVCFRRPGGLYS